MYFPASRILRLVYHTLFHVKLQDFAVFSCGFFHPPASRPQPGGRAYKNKGLPVGSPLSLPE
jgi:hypothetical protein